MNEAHIQCTERCLALEAERNDLYMAYQMTCDITEKNQAIGIEALREQVRVLRDALNAMLTHMGMDEDDWNKPTYDQARAALAATKEKT